MFNLIEMTVIFLGMVSGFQTYKTRKAGSLFAPPVWLFSRFFLSLPFQVFVFLVFPILSTLDERTWAIWWEYFPKKILSYSDNFNLLRNTSIKIVFSEYLYRNLYPIQKRAENLVHLSLKYVKSLSY